MVIGIGTHDHVYCKILCRQAGEVGMDGCIDNFSVTLTSRYVDILGRKNVWLCMHSFYQPKYVCCNCATAMLCLFHVATLCIAL